MPVAQLPQLVPYIALPPPYMNAVMRPPPIAANSFYPWQATQQMIRTEARKIIIKRLAHPTDKGTLRMFLYSVLPQECGYLQNIEVPRYGPNDSKGHAFVTFESFFAAQIAVDALDGYIWRGKTLSVGFTKEGAVTSRMTAKRQTLRHRPSTTPRSMAVTMSPDFSERRESVASSTVFMTPSPTGFSDSSAETMLDSPVCAPPKPSRTPAVVDGSCASQAHWR
jgi:RNA recognition motif. (a.k.a. RRM, RBD, or RNP domain)